MIITLLFQHIPVVTKRKILAFLARLWKHQSRVSYSVCVKTDPSQIEDDEDDAPGDLCASFYGNTLGFYKIVETDARLLEIECYDIVTEEKDRNLGY